MTHIFYQHLIEKWQHKISFDFKYFKWFQIVSLHIYISDYNFVSKNITCRFKFKYKNAL